MAYILKNQILFCLKIQTNGACHRYLLFLFELFEFKVNVEGDFLVWVF